MPDREARRHVREVLASKRYSPGVKVRAFERAFAQAHRAKHAVFVNSGTDALRLSLLALKEKDAWADGAQVVVPSLTFVATVNVVLQAGLKPYFVDVGMHDYTMNPDNLERRLSTSDADGIKAVMPVHLFGQAPDPRIYVMARERGWRVVEDSCETILNKPQGDVSCHSTYMAHHVTTGVGGMAVTDDTALMLLIRSYANHGRDTDYLPGFNAASDIKRRFRFERIGYSCRGTEFEAALGLPQLEHGRLERLVAERRKTAYFLFKALEHHDELVLPLAMRAHTWMMFPVVLREGCGIDKYSLCRHLEKSGIETRDMMPITNQPCYRGLVDEESFSVAKRINAQGFYIPCNPGMDVERVGAAFDSYFVKMAVAA